MMINLMPRPVNPVGETVSKFKSESLKKRELLDAMRKGFIRETPMFRISTQLNYSLV